MFKIFDINRNMVIHSTSDFPKYVDLKNILTWAEYCELLEYRKFGNLKLVYDLAPAEVQWSSRQATEFHTIKKTEHIKIGFFSLETLVHLTRHLSRDEFVVLLRRHYIATSDNQVIYVLE